MPRHVTDVESNGNITALKNENKTQFSQHNTLQLFDFENVAKGCVLTFIPKHWSITFFVMKMWTNMSAQGKMKREASGSFSTRILMELYWSDWSSLCYGGTTWKWKEMQEIPHAVRTSAFAVLKFAMLLLEIKHVLKLHFSDWQPSVSKSAKCCLKGCPPIHTLKKWDLRVNSCHSWLSLKQSFAKLPQSWMKTRQKPTKICQRPHHLRCVHLLRAAYPNTATTGKSHKRAIWSLHVVVSCSDCCYVSPEKLFTQRFVIMHTMSCLLQLGNCSKPRLPWAMKPY